MAKDISITLVQPRLVWESPVENYKLLNRLLSGLKTDLVVLPEMFSTGFSMDAARLSEEMEGPSMQWMFETARGLHAAVCGSLIIREGKKFYNRFIWMEPSGHYEQYDKRHLFRMGKEDLTYTPGKQGVVIEYKGWNFCPLVCYDLRFPVWSRNRIIGTKPAPVYDYDVLLYVANWPAVRNMAWKQLLIARAIENQCYVAGVNRVGQDGKGVAHTGDSVVLNPLGEKISTLRPNINSTETVVLESKPLKDLRKKFPVLFDADHFSLNS